MSNSLKQSWDDQSDTQKIESLKQMVDDLYYILYDVEYADGRYNLYELLRNATPADEKESHDIATMKKMLLKHPDILSSMCRVGHFTGSALVCDNQGRALLHFHKNLKKWLQFGGHADQETDFAKVAMRETQEETGLSYLKFVQPPREQHLQPIDFDIHTIPAKGDMPEHLHLDVRYMILTKHPDSLNPPEDESQQMLWRSFDAFINPEDPAENELIDPSLRRLLIKCRDRYYSAHKYHG
ncbi:MAG: NUDIX hydrolase [Chloroflexota bacterium]